MIAQRCRWRGRLLALAAAIGWAGVASAQEATLPHGPGSLNGIWGSSTYRHSSVFDPHEAVLKDADGRIPPLQPWATKLLDERVKMSLAGHPFINTKTLCLPSGIPQLLFGPRSPIQFLETPTQLVLLVEEFSYYRIVRLNGQHARDVEPSLLGDSIGHWEGDTLVVDTIGLSSVTVLDVPGMPHSDQLHVIERFRRTSPDKIALEVTIDDPKTFTRTWTALAGFSAVKDSKVHEYLCENQRDAPAEGAAQ